MKKTLLSVLAGFAVIGSAIAAPSPEDRKALCEKHPEKYVWVEKDQFCAPKYPCASKEGDIRNAYCIYTFYNAEESILQNSIVRDKLLKKDLGARNITNVEFSRDDCIRAESWQTGRVYCDDLPVLLVNYDGMYAEVPYGDDHMFVHTASGVACQAYGGWCTERGFEEYELDGKMPCRGIDSPETCKDLARFISDLEGKKVKGTWRVLESEGSVCLIEGTHGLGPDFDLGG